jgi:hypothetical protein
LGETGDGWLFGWGASGPDATTWGVATVSPSYMTAFFDELSFSSFLLHYCGYRDQLAVSFGREPWPGEPTFRPHRHTPR